MAKYPQTENLRAVHATASADTMGNPAVEPSQSVSDRALIQEIMPLLLGLISRGQHDVSRELDQGEPLADSRVSALRCGVVRQSGGIWVTDFWTGQTWSSAHAIASDAADRGEIIIDREFSALAVSPPSSYESAFTSAVPNMALLLSIGSRPGPAELLTTMARSLGEWLMLRRDRRDNMRRMWQLSTMLQAAAQWQQFDEDQELLESIARCACDVLKCERTTIFLWDKSQHRLIGRPAIGIKGGVLEVDDREGIVGEVLQSGTAKWWAAGGGDEGRVNRRVDEAQSFHTQSLVAVPMFNAHDQIVGVFEAINASSSGDRTGAFDAADARTLSELARHAVVAIESQRTRSHLTRTCDRLVTQAAESNPLIGNHESIRELRKQVTKVAATELSVLILGQNGTGKEVLAQQIHYQSGRRNGPFVAVNCAALVESLLESELFGHEKGAFTDASVARPGKFELAHGGTLFLDEIGDMSLGGQAKLLRVLESRQVVRVGGSQPIPVDTRVIAATNQPLQELIAAKRFREDLFFRLNVVSLTLPRLAGRGRDVILLAEHFLDYFCRKIGRTVPLLNDAAQRAMLTHPWPGNVRELRNTIERVCYLSTEDSISDEDLMLRASGATTADMPTKAESSVAKNLNDATRDFQIAHIESIIDACGGNMTQAAERMGLHRSNLYRKMRQLEMSTFESD